MTNATEGPTFFKNSWTNNANVFFVDQPIGVGFSYAEHGQSAVRDVFRNLSFFHVSYHSSQSTSEEAARDIAAFVAIFFENFSSFKGRAFHMAGESYGVCAHSLSIYWPFADAPACRDGIFRSLPLLSTTRTPCSLKRA